LTTTKIYHLLDVLALNGNTDGIETPDEEEHRHGQRQVGTWAKGTENKDKEQRRNKGISTTHAQQKKAKQEEQTTLIYLFL